MVLAGLRLWLLLRSLSCLGLLECRLSSRLLGSLLGLLLLSGGGLLLDGVLLGLCRLLCWLSLSRLLTRW